jgi:hypothetical protein
MEEFLAGLDQLDRPAAHQLGIAVGQRDHRAVVLDLVLRRSAGPEVAVDHPLAEEPVGADDHFVAGLQAFSYFPHRTDAFAHLYRTNTDFVVIAKNGDLITAL